MSKGGTVKRTSAEKKAMRKEQRRQRRLTKRGKQ